MKQSTGLPSPVAPVAPGVAREAVAWLLEWQTEAFTEPRQIQWRQWMERDAAHATAWACIARVDDRLRSLPAGIAIGTLASPGLSRRRSAKLALLLAGGAGGLQAARRTQTWQQMGADVATATGERRELLLPDGTRLTLDTGSAVDLRFSADQRTVLLRSGEVLVETAPDTRPFTVVTAQGSARPVGTRFTVRQHERFTTVAVLGGAVDIQPAAEARAVLRLQAGQRADFDRLQVMASGALRTGDAAWVDGMVVADDVPLKDFIDDLSRYRPGLLRCGDGTGGLRLSGTYPLADTDRVLAALTLSLPVQVEYRSRWWVTVALR